MSVHADFNAPHADMHVLSGDEIPILFHLHSANIRAHTTAFPVESMTGDQLEDDEPASFSEEADVLEVLFKFLYPEPPLPSLAKVPFDLLKRVAYASHKYQVAAAMAVCDIRMELAMKTNPACVFGYAYRYFDTERIDSLAVHVISQTPLSMSRELPVEGFVKWVHYREKIVSEQWKTFFPGSNYLTYYPTDVQDFYLQVQESWRSVAVPIAFSSISILSQSQ